jgi:hypothetical protein
MEIKEENSEKIWKIRKKPNLNSEMIRKIWGKKCEIIWKIEENCEMIWKIYFPYRFTFQLTFLPYFPYHFTLQPTFLPYFSYHFTIFYCIFQNCSLFDLPFMEEK